LPKSRFFWMLLQSLFSHRSCFNFANHSRPPLVRNSLRGFAPLLDWRNPDSRNHCPLTRLASPCINS
jgi:hypothetical protein